MSKTGMYLTVSSIGSSQSRQTYPTLSGLNKKVEFLVKMERHDKLVDEIQKAMSICNFINLHRTIC